MLACCVQLLRAWCYSTKPHSAASDFHAPIALLFFQCFVCCVLVQVCSILGLIKLEPWYALQSFAQD